MTLRKLGRNLSDLTGQPRMAPRAVPAKSEVARFQAGAARVLCVTSGKGGTGKSVLTSNLSTDLARRGKRVLVIDADLGLANLHLLLGVSPRRNLYHALSANLSFGEIAERTAAGVCLVPGPSGVPELADSGFEGPRVPHRGDGTVRLLVRPGARGHGSGDFPDDNGVSSRGAGGHRGHDSRPHRHDRRLRHPQDHPPAESLRAGLDRGESGAHRPPGLGGVPDSGRDLRAVSRPAALLPRVPPRRRHRCGARWPPRSPR